MTSRLGGKNEGRAAMRAFQLGMLRQAISATAGASSTPNQKRLAVISSLRIAAHQFKRAHAYKYAWWVHALCRELVASEKVRPVLSSLLREVQALHPTPAGNTGVKARRQKGNQVGTKHRQFMQSIFNGRGLDNDD